MFNLNSQSLLPEDEIYEDVLCEKTCPASAYQLANVSVPVTVTPFAKTGMPKVTCCGETVITPGKDGGCGRPGSASCSFTISQRISVEIPVTFGARASVGASTVDCECVTSKDLCKKHDIPCKDDCDEC